MMETAGSAQRNRPFLFGVWRIMIAAWSVMQLYLDVMFRQEG